MITIRDIFQHERYGPQLTLADTIATVAHGACGQTRADGKTPYIFHPRMAANLLLEQCKFETVGGPEVDLVAATLLHDVLEDTKISKEALLGLLGPAVGIVRSSTVVELVTLVTKPQEKMTGDEKEAYLKGIDSSLGAKRIKAADRCANLKDSIEQVKAGQNVDRWERYLYKTVSDILPMYKDDSRLETQYRHLSYLILDLISAIGRARANESMRRIVPCNVRCNQAHPGFLSNGWECSLNEDHVGYSLHTAHANHDINARKLAEWS